MLSPPSGSSPLSRGIHGPLLCPVHRVGIIPALAGNTLGCSRPVPGREDHPRSRGEYDCPECSHVGARGSSPLSRGILIYCRPPMDLIGIIPALAGNTHWLYMSSGLLWDHPRSRGEYPRPDRSLSAGPGSSPLSRGIHTANIGLGVLHGIIPALAGNTGHPGPGCDIRRDHPRSRGEYYAHGRGVVGEWGSSPLSRGIPAHGQGRQDQLRIIPALAGNTLRGPGGDGRPSDHPRSRGEYTC